ncbi:peptidyl-prolyl cis trans isomerase, partial [Apiospora aurea]
PLKRYETRHHGRERSALRLGSAPQQLQEPPLLLQRRREDLAVGAPAGTDTEKLKRYMALHHSTSASQPGAQKPADKIRAAHLLVKHRDSRRPASWRESEITRTKDEARSIIQGHEARIKRGEISLGELAMSESDCSSARKRGDLGYFGKGDMQKPFEEAAFALQPGQMSEVIETDSGLHLIERYVAF